MFVYLLTGIEPRVLIDHSGRKPHQRPDAREALRNLFEERQLLRVMSRLDKAFAIELLARYRTAPDLVYDLESAMQSDQEGDDDLESLLAEVDEIALSHEQTVLGAQRESLMQLMNVIRRTVRNLAESRPNMTWTQTSVSPKADELWAEDHLSIQVYGAQPSFAAYRVEPRGADEYVVLVDGVEVWRGESADEPLTNAIEKAAAKKFLGR